MVSPFLISALLATTALPQAVRVMATAAPVSCTFDGSCAKFANKGSGSGLSLASGGTGLVAVSSSGNGSYPGLDGEITVEGPGAGAAFGLDFLNRASPPTYGALAYGVVTGLFGATTGYGSPSSVLAGVFGQDDSVQSSPDDNAGVLGASMTGLGVLGEANGRPDPYAGTSPFGTDAVGAFASGYEMTSSGGIGLVAESDSNALLATDRAGRNYVVLAQVGTAMISAISNGPKKQRYFTVDLSGNGSLSGTLTTEKGTYARTLGASGARRMTYGMRGISPLIDDVGEAALINGRAYVAVDSALADSLDMRLPYHVLVTPEGACKQLYVTQKTPEGFVVREASGGRSTLAFEYRIVGKPFDDDGTTAGAERSPATRAVHGARLRRRLAAAVGAPHVRPLAKPASTNVECSSAAPASCDTVENNSTGSAMTATATSGIGAIGTSAAGDYRHPGVDGESNNVTGTDAAAAFGLNFLTMGTAPSGGTSALGLYYGFYGATEDGYGGGQVVDNAAGVFGQDQSTSLPNYNSAVTGRSQSGTGVLAESNGDPQAGFYGQSPIGIYGVADTADQATGSVGVVAESNDVALEAEIPGSNLSVDLVHTTNAGIDLIDAANGSSSSFVVTAAGNATFTGTVTAKNSVYARTTGASGVVRVAYGSREASPDVESVGEARMTNGRAYVALDPVLADSIDMRRPYDVSVTPEGDAKTLYVAQRTPTGFIVCESHGGRSTLAFEYRVVGKPVDDDARRLAAAPLPAMPARPSHRGPRIGPPLSPTARALSLKGSR